MTKIKTLAIILVVAMMLMGAGYAIWTDEVAILGTVETGHMNINIKDKVEIKSEGVVVGEILIDNEKDIASADISLTELVPGGYAEFKFTFENDGNIDVKGKEIILESDLGELEGYLYINPDKIKDEKIDANNGTLDWTLRIELEKIEAGGNNTQAQSGTLTIKPQFVQAFGQ